MNSLRGLAPLLRSAHDIVPYKAGSNAIYNMAVTFVLWLATFGIGVAVPSVPFRQLIVSTCFSVCGAPLAQAEPPRSAEAPFASGGAPVASPATQRAAPVTVPLVGWSLLLLPATVVVVFVTYTPTNLILLCSLGAMLGAYALRIAQERTGAPRAPEAIPPTATAMLHGLCIYLGILGGLIVVQGNLRFDSAEPDLYFRVAALATLFSIAAGTNKQFLHHLTHAFKPFGVDRQAPVGDGTELKPWNTAGAQASSAAAPKD